MELWQVYGSRSEYLEAPYEETTEVRLALEARWKVENERQAEMDAKIAAARGGK